MIISKRITNPNNNKCRIANPTQRTTTGTSAATGEYAQRVAEYEDALEKYNNDIEEYNNSEALRMYEKMREKARRDIRYEKVGGDENDNRAVTIIGAEKEHGFANFGEARKWAKKNIVGEYNNPEIGGVNISGTAIDKYLSEKAVSKSDNKDVHLSALKVMPSIIENSIVGEVHEDKKGDRHLKDVVRLYGAIDIDGQNYRVKTTVKRYNSENEKSKAYSYEVTEIELLEGTHGDDNNGELPRSGNNSISAAKLLNISETAKNNSQETEREEIAQRDKEYAEAVAAGDKEKIDAMLREEMRRKGYADNSDYQGNNRCRIANPTQRTTTETSAATGVNL